MTQLLRTSPGLIVTIALMVGCAVVCTVGGLLMKRTGASLKPMYWFVGFFALVVLPQFVIHLYKALHSTKTEAPRVAALQNIAAAKSAEGRFDDAKMLFGPDVDPQLIVDARQMGSAFAQAEFAQFVALPNG